MPQTRYILATSHLAKPLQRGHTGPRAFTVGQDMEPITRKALAERLGLSPQRISDLVKPGQPLAAAVRGKYIDGRHPCIAEYIEARATGQAPSAKHRAPPKRTSATPAKKPAVKKPAVKKPAVKKPPATTTGKIDDDELLRIEPGEVPEQLQRFQNLTIRQIVNRYGTLAQFEYFLKAAKTIEEVQERRLKNAEREGELIPREFVERYLFGYLEGITQRLLNDAPKTITHRIAAAVKAGEHTGDIEKTVLRLIGQDLRGAKDQIMRRLRSAKRSTN